MKQRSAGPRRSGLEEAGSRGEGRPAPDIGTWEWEFSSDRVYLSSEAERLLGMSATPDGHSVEECLLRIHEPDRQVVVEQMERSVEQLSEYRAQFRVVGPDGSVHWLDARGRPTMRQADRSHTMHGLVIDTTARRQSDTVAEQQMRILTRLAERDRIGMDLHDNVLQSLYSTVLNLAAVERSRGDPKEVVQQVQQARVQLEEAIVELRQYVHGLHTPPDDLNRALGTLADELAQTGLELELRVDLNLSAGTSPETNQHIIAIIREAIANAVRHGDSKHLLVEARDVNGNTCVSIKDDGRGFRRRRSDGLGLENMRVRAAVIGAQLDIKSEPGVGTCVQLLVPAGLDS